MENWVRDGASIEISLNCVYYCTDHQSILCVFPRVTTTPYLALGRSYYVHPEKQPRILNRLRINRGKLTPEIIKLRISLLSSTKSKCSSTTTLKILMRPAWVWDNIIKFISIRMNGLIRCLWAQTQLLFAIIWNSSLMALLALNRSSYREVSKVFFIKQ